MPIVATPFQEVPRNQFLMRMLRPGIFVFLLGFLLMGALSEGDLGLPAFQMAQYQYSRFGYELQNFPDRCGINEVEARRCAEFWSRFQLRAFWVAFPFLCVALLMGGGLVRLRRLYARAEKKLHSAEGLFTGTVTEPPEALNDLYGWFHLFRAIAVELPDKRQLRVYVPASAAVPSAGQKLVIVALERFAGKKRYGGMLYAPNMAVIKGLG